MLDKPIFITGCARSGSSMTGGIVSLCGAWGGIMSGPTAYNKKGMFENAEIRNTMIKPLLERLGFDPNSIVTQIKTENHFALQLLYEKTAKHFRLTKNTAKCSCLCSY